MSKKLRQPHRDNYEIMKQILQTVYSKSDGCRSFELAYSCRLPWQQFIHYRNFLVGCELLVPSGKGPAQHYEITSKGLRCLQILAEIEDDLKSVTNN